ncbi:Protein kinase domain protein [Theileria parva strain Muguga]|uniref:Protein kinase domain protein n=1 Tax=Theileria parva strain Muguga TaxID=333668 RepID=UPI001C61E3E4|nr:Protein kinase domain protein [Theileria parva strain Muguga]EAN32459.2 Protein kinase domain protein [Theileria parva strain Muguga]
MATNRKLSVQTRSMNSWNLVNNGHKCISEKALDKKINEAILVPKGNKPPVSEEKRTPTTTVTNNSFFSSSITTSTTATTISTKQYNYYSNIISSTLTNNAVTNTPLKGVTENCCPSKDISPLAKSPEQKKSNKDIKYKSYKETTLKCTKNVCKDFSFRTKAVERGLVGEPLDKNFSSVLKGNYTTYRKKYLEGPVVGRGSFGVVKTLFSMVEILDLYQFIPTKLRPPINNLSLGIKRLSENRYEFCGVSLTSPTRAAKIMNFDKIKKTGSKNLLHILREVSIGSWNDHPNIVKVKEIYLNEQIIKYLNNINNLDDREMILTGKNNNVYLVMEYCSGGDLSKLVIDEVNKENIIPRIFVQIFKSLSYINSRGIAHRDVKPENFLITVNEKETKSEDAEIKDNDDITVKLADFGLANSSPRVLKTRAGTPYYVAPEIIKCNGHNCYSVKCDSWSAGIMLHIFLLGTCPFHDESDVKKLNKVVNEEIDWTHQIYATIPPEAYDLLKKLLVKNPSKRISTTDSLKHLYFQKFTGYAPLLRSINGNTLIDKLIQFYKFPILKRVALCIMIRQISEYKLDSLTHMYKYLVSFSQDLNTLTIPSLTNYVNYYKLNSELNKDSTYNNKIDKLYYLKQFLNIDEIGFTEFVASQMASELCQNNDLIANVFAGLHSDLPGRRSLFINEQDLARLTTSYTHDYSNLGINADLDQDLELKLEADAQILSSINHIISDACEYSDKIYSQNKMEGNSHGLGGFLRSTRGPDKEASMSIDEFFLMMSFNLIDHSHKEEGRQIRIKRKKVK